MAAWSNAACATCEVRRIVVLVTLVNEQGHQAKILGFGETLRDALTNAAQRMREATGDDSWDAVEWETA